MKYLPIILLFCFRLSFGSNVQVEINSVDRFSNEIIVIGSVSWEHSWNENTSSLNNHDAIWSFVKLRQNDTFIHGEISNVLSLNDSISLIPVNDSLGFFIEPELISSNQNRCSGRFQITIRLEEGISVSSIFIGAIEMVYVPSGAFYIGDEVSNNTLSAGNGESLLIESENELIKGSSRNQISSINSEAVVDFIPESFPKGFEAFYCMKYEISQVQYADFLNHSDYVTQNNLFSVSPQSDRGTTVLQNNARGNFNGISIQESGDSILLKTAILGIDVNDNTIFNELNDGNTLACNFLDWDRLIAYLNWVGLRPMTELEFEKACRGPELPVEKDFAFGSAFIVDANTLINELSPTETYTDNLPDNFGIGVHGFLGRFGPLRTGFAASESSNRLSAGASYWGIMELSGNLWEQTITVARTEGTLFTGSNGTGNISVLPQDWPNADGGSYRGGAWNSGIFPQFRDLAVSDRFFFDLNTEQIRNTGGGRGVRTLNNDSLE